MPVLPDVGSRIVWPGAIAPARLGVLDHRARDAILDRAGRVARLELGPDAHAGLGRQPLELDQRRVPDRLDDVAVAPPAGLVLQARGHYFTKYSFVERPNVGRFGRRDAAQKEPNPAADGVRVAPKRTSSPTHEEDEMSDRWSRLAPLTAIPFGALVVIAILVSSSTDPNSDASGATVIAYYQAHGSDTKTADFLFIFAFIFFLFFAGSLRAHLRRTPAAEALSALVLAGATLLVVGVGIFSGIDLALSDQPSRLTPGGGSGAESAQQRHVLPHRRRRCMFGISAGLAILRGPALPKWLGWLAIVIGIASASPAGFFGVPGGDGVDAHRGHRACTCAAARSPRRRHSAPRPPPAPDSNDMAASGGRDTDATAAARRCGLTPPAIAGRITSVSPSPHRGAEAIEHAHVLVVEIDVDVAVEVAFGREQLALGGGVRAGEVTQDGPRRHRPRPRPPSRRPRRVAAPVGS